MRARCSVVRYKQETTVTGGKGRFRRRKQKVLFISAIQLKGKIKRGTYGVDLTVKKSKPIIFSPPEATVKVGKRSF